MANSIRVVVDSGADLPANLRQSLNISVVPLLIHFGDRVFKDGIDISSELFYDMLKTEEELPRTSQPSPGDFLDMYRKIAKPGDTILSFHLSGKLSGTLQSAQIAANQIDDVRIQVIDTGSASMGIGLPAVIAARMVREGRSVEEILERTKKLVRSIRILFLVDTLEFLQKNGRIGKAQAWVGGLLQVKPILSIQDGVVTPVEKVRGQRKALSRLVDLTADSLGDRRFVGAVIHSAAEEQVQALAAELKGRVQVDEMLTALLGPTIGTHAGPGTIGVIWFGDPD